MKKLMILGDMQSPYVRELFQSAESNPKISSVKVQDFSELASSIGHYPIVATGSSKQESWSSKRESWTISQIADAILVRTMPLGSLEQVIFRMDYLQRCQDLGSAVVNRPKTLETAIDKWLTLHRLEMSGLAVPKTIACQTRDQALEAFESLDGDVVVKPIFGGEGRGLVRVSDPDMAWRVFSGLQQMRCVLYLQEYLPHEGYDIRVLFVGNKHYAVRRHAKSGSWKTNVSQGATTEAHSVSEQELSVALRARDSVDGTVVGVDLLPCRDGQLYTLEVNAVPGWRGLASALQVDIAREIIEMLGEI